MRATLLLTLLGCPDDGTKVPLEDSAGDTTETGDTQADDGLGPCGEVDTSAVEICNGIDDDCDNEVDEGVLTTFYGDVDGDSHGIPDTTVEDCSMPAGYAETADDCDDADADVFPGAQETCDGVDEDCDGEIDDGVSASTWYADDDGDGYGDANDATRDCAQPAGSVADATDCDDTDASARYCRSCQHALDVGFSSTDGVLTLDPCGGAPSDYWCDMTTDGGGWTLAGWQAANSTDTLGLSVRNAPGDPDFSVDLACVPYDEIAVFNTTFGEWESQSYDGSTWSETSINLDIGDPGQAFAHGTYGPSDSLMTMACVDYAYSGAIVQAYACDTDGQGGARGHITDYAGEYCGPRLDYTWAWTDGISCTHTGEAYTWGYMLRGYGVGTQD